MIKEKSKKNWLKQPSAAFLSGLLVASSFMSVLGPSKVEAADPAVIGPGGVNTDLISWVDMEKSVEEGTISGGLVTVLKDLADSARTWTPYGSHNQPESELGGNMINYHHVTNNESTNRVQFETNKGLGTPASGKREVFSVQVRKGVSTGFPWDLGGETSGNTKYDQSGIIADLGSTQKDEFIPKATLSNSHILNVWSGEDDWRLSINGDKEQAYDTSGVLWKSIVTRHHYIGSAHHQTFNGHIAEVLVFNNKLTGDERKKVNSYLALKYGATLKNEDGTSTDYVASDDSTMWTAANNVGYGHRITGLGLDEAGGINQKQSKSEEDDANVAIAVGEFADSNKLNQNTIATDNSFFTISDNGGEAIYDTVIENNNLPDVLKHTNDTTKTTTKMSTRVYKVDKTNWIDQNITLQVDGADENGHQYYLYVHEDDAGFPIATTKVYETDKTTGKVTLNSSEFADGSYFTFIKHVDKKDLEILVDTIDAENLQEADYVSGWAAFQQALTAAKAVLTDANKTVSEVKGALNALNTARNALQGAVPLTSSPGGVKTNLKLWLKADDVVTLVGETDKIKNWADQTGLNTFKDLTSDYPTTNSVGANFHPTVVFPESTNSALLPTDNSATFKIIEAFAVASNGLKGTIASPTVNVGGLANSLFEQGLDSQLGGGNNRYLRSGTIYTPVYLSTAATTAGKGWLNGFKNTTFQNVQNPAEAQIQIGIRNGANRELNGNLAELVIFGETITDAERKQVQSYLSLKYGITLKADDGASTDYIASDGSTKMWAAESNADYGAHITGIGRDDNGALNHKQSKSQLDDANVTIALGDTIAATNSANTNTITTDKSFFTFSDNDKDAKFVTPLSKETEGLRHLERIYKVDKTNWQDTNVTLEVDKVENAIEWPLYLVVSSDATFDAQDTFYPLTDGKVTISSSLLEDGQYFTFAAPAPKPTGATLQETQANGNEITLTFDKEVELTDATGFTIKVGDDAIDLTNATFKVDPTDSKKVIITLPTDTDVTDKEVNVSYDGTGNLKGTNGVPVNDFEVTTEDSFTAALTITKPDAQVTLSKPEMTGKVEAGSEVKVVIKDKDGNEVTGVGGNATVDQNGNWTFTPSTDLEDGDYTVEVTATKDGKTATKTKDFTVSTKQTVDYTQVTDVTDINPIGVTYDKTTGKFTVPSDVTEFTFKDGDKEKKAKKNPTTGEWTFTEFVDYTPTGAITEIDPSGVTFENGKFEVPSDVTEFTFKDGDKEMTATKGPNGEWTIKDAAKLVDKSKLQAKHDAVESLTSSPYTSATWGPFETARTAADIVLKDPNATQQQVDDALTALNDAYEALKKKPVSPPDPAPTVDKSELQAKADEVSGLKEKDYTPDSWKAFEDAKKAADDVLKDPNATQQQVDDALDALKDAQDKLVSVGVDKSKLQAQVDEAAGLKETEYKPDGWKAFEDAKKAADDILKDPNATQQQVDDALDALKDAQDKLVSVGVDKSKLQAQADEAAGLKETEYTPDSWNAFKTAKEAADDVLKDPNATQQQVDDALDALKDAQDKLVSLKVDKSKLQAQADEANGLKEKDYKPDGWKAFKDAKTAADNVLKDPNATQQEVNDALNALKGAQNNLVPQKEDIDKSMLKARVDVVTGLKEADYTTESWANLQPTLNNAISTLNDSNATQQQINDAYDALVRVHDALVPLDEKVDKTVLDQKLTEVNGLSKDDYTEESWNKLENALTSAKDVFDNPNATQQEVNAATTEVRAAQNGLVKKQDGGGSSGGGGGGSSWTPSPTDSTGPTTETIIVDLEIDGDQPIEKTSVEIKRTKETNGQITDRVELTQNKAQEAVNKAKEIGNNIARIVIPDPKDEVDKVTVEISKQSIATFRANGIDLEIYTGNALLTIPQTSMEGIEDDFYFRLVPVKTESERKAIEERAKVEQVVREVMQSEDIHVVARPMTIETNLSSRPVLVTLPLRDVVLPTNPVERETFLNQLAVFIEHSDGEKKVVFGEVVTLPNGELGLQVSVNKFSTFTIINLGKKVEVQTHEAYIKGFPNGTFKPNDSVTRKQIALMIARNLGYKDSDAVTRAPFNDVAKDADGAGAIAYLKSLGIMNGDEHGNFNGSNNITRAQMAIVIANYKQLEIKDVPVTFTDTKNHWSKLQIEANREAGIITGFEDGTFRPQAHLTRAQAVKMINRMFDRGPLHGVSELHFSDVSNNHWAFIEIAEAAMTHDYTIKDDEKEWLVK